MVEAYIRAGLVSFIHGSPSIGKSEVVKAIANKYNLQLIDVRLSQCDVTDLNGFPKLDGAKATYVPMDTFPLEGQPLPEGKAGWCLFFDEANSAPRSVQASCYKIILDRMVGQHKLHSKVAIVAAGNLATDNAIVEEMSTALQSRMCHIEVEVDVEDWLAWAYQNGIDYRITSYIQFKPSSLYTFKPDHSDKTFASPRTWSFCNKLLGNTENLLPLLAGAIGEGVAREFVGFMKIHNDLPKMATILASPELVKVPDEPSILYALTGALAQLPIESFDKAMVYVERLPLEFQVVCIKEAIKRNPAVFSHKSVVKWCSTKSHELF